MESHVAHGRLTRAARHNWANVFSASGAVLTVMDIVIDISHVQEGDLRII
jgi:hypothetical protein